MEAHVNHFNKLSQMLTIYRIISNQIMMFFKKTRRINTTIKIDSMYVS